MGEEVKDLNWFEKLNEYFPVEEMKSREHIELLLKEKGNVYHKDEGREHVLLYAEFDEFIFIDYLYVAPSSRSRGLGRQLINKLKEKEKTIILEVEPVDYKNSDTSKRLNFYQKAGFKHARSIDYNPHSLATDQNSPLEILYWSPRATDEQSVYDQMCRMYEEIHTYKDLDIYGKSYQPVEKVLIFDLNRETEDILQGLPEKE